MRTATWSRRFRFVFVVVTFVVGALAFYAYYRGLIENRRKAYVNAATISLSISSDQLGSLLANLRTALPSALRGSKPGEPILESQFQNYVQSLMPALDKSNCETSRSKPTSAADPKSRDQKEPALADPANPGGEYSGATIFVRHQQGMLRFRLAVESLPPPLRRGVRTQLDTAYCADVKPDVISSKFQDLPDTIEDLMVVSADGAVQFQSAGIGPRVVNLKGLLNLAAQTQADESSRSILTGLISSAPRSGTSGLEQFQSWMQDALRTRVTDATSFSNVVRVKLAGEDYFAIIQPISFIKAAVGPKDDQDLALVGLINNRALDAKASAMPIVTVAWAFLALVFIYSVFFLVSCVPMKSRLQRIRRLDLALIAFCALTFCAALTLAITHIYFTVFEDHKESAHSLEVLGERMGIHLEEELCQLYYALQGMTGSPDFAHALEDFSRLGKNGASHYQLVPSLLKAPKDKITAGEIAYARHPFFDSAFWTDYDGNQIAKWTIHRLPTPPTDMLQFQWFLESRDQRVFELRGRTPQNRRMLGNQNAQGVYVEPLFSPNTSEFLTTLTKKYDYGPEKGFVGVIVAPLSSLNAPVLPPGYGFSVVRRDGSVLFSSNTARNLRENLLRECGLDDRLRKALDTGIAHTMETKYGGKDVLMYVRPFDSLDGAGWSIVTYRDLERDQTMQADTFTQTMKFMLPHALMMFFLAAALRFVLGRKLSPDLWPRGTGSRNTFNYA
jgi:hypothetical protein